MQVAPPLVSDPAAAASGLPLSTLSNVDTDGRLIDPTDVRVQYLKVGLQCHDGLHAATVHMIV